MSANGGLEHASLVRPRPGERVAGDAAIVRSLERGLLVAIVDVLGHGPEAHEVARVVDEFLAGQVSSDPCHLIRRLHERLRGTRGAAVGLCAIDESAGEVVYVGTGNTVVRRFGKVDSRLVSQDGIVGQNMRTPRPQDLRLDAGDVIVLYTDGVSDHFTSEDYPGVLHHEPKRVVSTIVERFGKDHDDAACIAVKFGD